MSTFRTSFAVQSTTPPGLSAWEVFLRCTGVPENSCASHVEGGTQQGTAIRSWVRENYGTRYVPEYILESLGLRKQLVQRWQGDDQQTASYVSAGGAD
ncbi:MAG: hypothetical protein WBA18_03195 [Terracidiphilus sp.]